MSRKVGVKVSSDLIDGSVVISLIRPLSMVIAGWSMVPVGVSRRRAVKVVGIRSKCTGFVFGIEEKNKQRQRQPQVLRLRYAPLGMTILWGYEGERSSRSTTPRADGRLSDE
jgi:hypothetical protein